MRAQVKGFMELSGDTTVGRIKRRMQEELVSAAPVDQVDKRLTWLAEQTGDNYKNVQRWVNGNVEPPVDFVVRFCDVTNRRLDYILAGRLPKAIIPPSESERIVQRIYEAMQVPTELYKPLPRPVNGDKEEAGGS